MRLLFVHAHPDDETITTGGTIATYAAAGHDVTVLTCTLGEEGEVIGSEWAGLVADRADQLGGYRIAELTSALAHLGARPPRFLGAAGRWRDSGMAGTASAANPRAFVNADSLEAVSALIAVIREVRPHVVVAYDPLGGYGHPDHVQAHRLTTAAVAEAGADGGWDVPKFYWTVTDAGVLDRAATTLDDIPETWRRPAPGELPGVPPGQVTTRIDIAAVLDAKRAALRAHATQVTVADSGAAYALSNNIGTPLLAEEHYVLVRGDRAAIPETDLLAGIV